MAAKKTASRSLEECLNFCKEVVSDYKFHESEQRKQEDLQQDLLHKAALEKLTQGETAKLTTALSKCRRERRKHKDACEELEPIYKWLSDEKNKRCINSLKEVLGQIRTAERKHTNRHYNNRVLKG